LFNFTSFDKFKPVKLLTPLILSLGELNKKFKAETKTNLEQKKSAQTIIGQQNALLRGQILNDSRTAAGAGGHGVSVGIGFVSILWYWLLSQVWSTCGDSQLLRELLFPMIRGRTKADRRKITTNPNTIQIAFGFTLAGTD